ncbi:MAG: response regulator transcription factor, partial [Longimicrobiales bacterium]
MQKILIVEDNVDLLVVLKEVLSRDYEVVTARRGEDAVTLARTYHPDLVILDLQLPAMDGIEAGRWIKREVDNVPILVLTALAGKGEPEAILASGCCDAYMAKPAPLEAIRARVVELLESGARAHG